MYNILKYEVLETKVRPPVSGFNSYIYWIKIVFVSLPMNGLITFWVSSFWDLPKSFNVVDLNNLIPMLLHLHKKGLLRITYHPIPPFKVEFFMIF